MDNLKENTLITYGKDFQAKSIVALLTDKAFLERIFDILSPDYWEMEPHKWAVSKLIEYYPKYKSIPTPEVMAIEVKRIEDELLRNATIIELKAVYSLLKSPDLAYVKDLFLTFCKNQKLKTAILDAHNHLKSGDYDKIWEVINDASKAGVERNVGHNYLNDVDARFSGDIRNTIRTNWPIIDKHLDGGLGSGELGFVIAPSGSGKCVGPTTKIEIQYQEIGIPVVGNSGSQYIIWIKPYESFDLGIGVGTLYGWQIELLLS